MRKLPENIKRYRKKNRITQKEFAERLFVTKQAVSKWETGRGYPDSSIIPAIAKEIGITIDELMGEKRSKKRYMILFSIVFIIAIVFIIVIPKIIADKKETAQFNEYRIAIEDTTGLDLPDQGDLVYVNFTDWTQYNNFVPVTRMSYFVFDDSENTRAFELGLLDDIRWIRTIDEDLLVMIPSNLHNYASAGDYYAIYNIDTETFNDLDIETGTHEYLFVVYQLEYKRLLIFDYSIHLEEGE